MSHVKKTLQIVEESIICKVFLVFSICRNSYLIATYVSLIKIVTGRKNFSFTENYIFSTLATLNLDCLQRCTFKVNGLSKMKQEVSLYFGESRWKFDYTKMERSK